MNQDPSQDNGFGDGGNETQTNPFTGDLKGEFSSDFGTNTNAVSQMFKGEGFGGDRKRTILLAVGGLVVVALLAFLLIFDEGEQGFDDFAVEPQMEQTQAGQQEDAVDQQDDDQMAQGQEGALDETALDGASEGEGSEDALSDAEGGEGVDGLGSPDGLGSSEGLASENSFSGGGAITINSPFDGATLTYDETRGPATFNWEGNADRIVFSRSSSMTPIVRSRNVSGKQSYRYLHPHSGKWFWRLENAEGSTSVQSFTIAAPVRRNFPITSPQEGGQIAGEGGVISWQGDTKVARYSVQLISQGGSWATPLHQFGTSGNSVALSGVTGGTYDIRVGAFSEIAGRWEWQVIRGVVVQ